MQAPPLFLAELQQMEQVTARLQHTLAALATTRTEEEDRLLQLIKTMVEALSGSLRW